MPLIRKKRVIECTCSWYKFLKLLPGKRNSLLFCSSLESTVIFNLAHLTELCKVCRDFLYGMLIAETNDIPEMKSLFTCLILCTEIYREDSLDLISVHEIKYLINSKHT